MLQRAGIFAERLARYVAVLGGIVLTSLAVLTTISIIGRAGLDIGLKPIPGDFELIEAGAAFAVCAFLPWAQLMRSHASVGIFTDRLGGRSRAVIDLMADLFLFAAAILLTWRHIFGMLDKQANGETTFILQFPLWWAYAACLIGLVAWIAVGAWCVWASAIAVANGQPRTVESGAAL